MIRRRQGPAPRKGTQRLSRGEPELSHRAGAPHRWRQREALVSGLPAGTGGPNPKASRHVVAKLCHRRWRRLLVPQQLLRQRSAGDRRLGR